MPEGEVNQSCIESPRLPARQGLPCPARCHPEPQLMQNQVTAWRLVALCSRVNPLWSDAAKSGQDFGQRPLAVRRISKDLGLTSNGLRCRQPQVP
jgi:hypothetical protein